MQTFQGLAVSDGLTVGPVVRIDRGAAGLHRIVCDPFRERALYEAAIVLAKDELNRLQQHACGQDADILMFQIALLEDESFTNEIGDYIAAGAGSAAAVERAEQIFAGRLKNVDDDYIRERSVDVCDACRRVVDILDGRPSRRLHLTEPSILVAELFYPSDLFGQAPGMILGLASETDSETSHAAIMARSMGIPAVFQLGKGVAAAAAGCRAVVDAEHAQLIIDPTAAQLRQVKARRQELQNSNALPDPLAAAPCRTRDGTLAVVTEDQTSMAKLLVYSPSMEQQLSWSMTSNDGTPLRMAFSPDSRKLAAAAVTVSGGQVMTNLYLINLASGDPVSLVNQGGVPQWLGWTSASTILAVYDTRAVLYNAGGGERAVYDFAGTELKDVSVDAAGNVALLLASGQVSQAVTLDKNLNVQFSAAVSAANSIVRAGNLFYLLADNAVECFDASGTQQWSQNLDTSPQALLANSKDLLLFSGNTVQKLEAPAE